MYRRTALASAFFVSLTGLAGCDQWFGEGGKRLPFKGVDITGAKYARALSLPDTDGHLRTLADYKGKVVVVFFGYAQCPDVCPTTLAELATIKTQLGERSKEVQVVFVTLDPERDTADILKGYMGSFGGSDFVALRGTPEQVKAAAAEFKVFYSKVQGKTDDTYTIDHTAGSFLFDRDGKVRVFSRYGGGPDAMGNDLKILLDQPASAV